MNYNAWFRCSEGCGETYPLTEVIYRCRNCGGLLEVQHDTEALETMQSRRLENPL